MWEIIVKGGWIMAPILLCSIVALGIILERFWSLRTAQVVPANLVHQVWEWTKSGAVDRDKIKSLRATPLGRVLAAGLVNVAHSREVMKESIEDTGRHVVHDLERFLNTLGTIAAISPLLGLLGTVSGMISIFSSITEHGVGNPAALAGGIAEALITTFAGLVVAIPALMFHRYFRGKVDELVVRMEQEALLLVEVMHGEREADLHEAAQAAQPRRPARRRK